MLSLLDAICHTYGWTAAHVLREVPVATLLILLRQRRFANGDVAAGRLAQQEFVEANKVELQAFLEREGAADGR